MRLAERPYIESGWISHVGKVVLLAATYWVIAKAALLTAIPPGYATALWPASRRRSVRAFRIPFRA